MSYHVHITRKATSWADEQDPAAISREEWASYVAADPEMQPESRAEALADDSPGATVAEGEGGSVWLPYSKNGRGGRYARFWHEGGGIVVKNPDEEILGKMLTVAHALGARVQGDDGEYFDEDTLTYGPRPEESQPAWVTSDFRDFQTFTSAEAAQPLLDALGQQGLDYRTTLDTGQLAFDPSFANNQLASKFIVKLRLADFERGNHVVAGLYENALRHLRPDHYLFSFTDEELCDILARPDEWSALDVALASQLLRQRGHDLSATTVQLLRQHRTAELAQPDERYPAWIWAGYLAALAGGFGGILLGYQLCFGRKQLPDGRRVYANSPDDRAHGLRILALGTFMFLLLLTLRLTR